MKKATKYIALTICIAAVITLTAPRSNADTPAASTYPAAMAVVAAENLDADIYLVTVKTMTGFMYQFITDAPDWFPGEIAALIMSDSGTENITDDEIIVARYAGYGDPATW